MAKNPKTEPDDPAQSKRFVETAKALASDESGKSFVRAFKKVVPRPSKAKRQKAA